MPTHSTASAESVPKRADCQCALVRITVLSRSAGEHKKDCYFFLNCKARSFLSAHSTASAERVPNNPPAKTSVG